jgi:drug/metabolite transporter (DMT)-like permease
MTNYIGELAAVATALFWTVTALAFERASLRVGSLAVNIIRLFIGFLFLSVFTYFYRNSFFPYDASFDSWFWLMLSGFVGFVFGDLFLFRSFTVIGSRFAMLIMTMVPPITALSGWIILGEKLTFMNFVGMFLTIGGISCAIFSRNNANRKLSLKLSVKGILFAFGGALGQALGLVLSKFGMKSYDPFAATQIRLIAGMLGLTVLVTILGRWGSVIKAFSNRQGMAAISLGSFFGPCLGVSFSLLAIQHAKTGIASTIMAIVPVLLIPPAVFLYKEKVTIFEILGAIVSICGVALFFVEF